MAPNFCSRATRKSLLFHRNHLLGTPQFFLEHSLARGRQGQQKRKYPAFLTSHLVNKAKNVVNIFSRMAFYIAFKGLGYAIFCSLRGLNVSWRKFSSKNNGPILLFKSHHLRKSRIARHSSKNRIFFCSAKTSLLVTLFKEK